MYSVGNNTNGNETAFDDLYNHGEQQNIVAVLSSIDVCLIAARMMYRAFLSRVVVRDFSR
jgi:hypothetical protein